MKEELLKAIVMFSNLAAKSGSEDHVRTVKIFCEEYIAVCAREREAQYAARLAACPYGEPPEPPEEADGYTLDDY